MAGTGKLKIKLNPEEFKALLTAVQFVLNHYEIVTQEEWLYMFLHRDFRNKLLTKSLTEQREYSIGFDEAETMWFWLLWQRIDLAVFQPYEAQLMQSIINKVDKHKMIITNKKNYEAAAGAIEGQRTLAEAGRSPAGHADH